MTLNCSALAASAAALAAAAAALAAAAADLAACAAGPPRRPRARRPRRLRPLVVKATRACIAVTGTPPQQAPAAYAAMPPQQDFRLLFAGTQLGDGRTLAVDNDTAKLQDHDKEGILPAQRCPLFVGRLLELGDGRTSSADHVAAKLQGKEGIPPDQQRLLFESRGGARAVGLQHPDGGFCCHVHQEDTAPGPPDQRRLLFAGQQFGDGRAPSADHAMAKEQYVAQVKQFQRMGVPQNELWHVYADFYLGGVRDPARHHAATLQVFCQHHAVPPAPAGGSSGVRLRRHPVVNQREPQDFVDAWDLAQIHF